MSRVAIPFRIQTMAALITVAVSYQLIAQDDGFPVSFKFHCGGKARYTIPKAMGFSPDCKALAIWYKRSLIFVDASTGKETKRFKTADELSYGNPYNYVAFDSTGNRCCICYVGSGDVLLQFFDIEKRLGSKSVAQKFEGYTPTERGRYVSHGYHLPLRQWLAFQTVGDATEATCQALFPGTDDEAARREHFRVSFKGDVRLKKADQILSSMGGEQAIKEALNNRSYAGYRMQVALSLDQRTLLTQFIVGDIGHLRYRFVFHDANSKKKVAEITIPTGIDWRFRGSRGFAFSPDFRRMARTMPGGHVIVHDLSALIERKLVVPYPIVIPIGQKTTTKK